MEIIRNVHGWRKNVNDAFVIHELIIMVEPTGTGNATMKEEDVNYGRNSAFYRGEYVFTLKH